MGLVIEVKKNGDDPGERFNVLSKINGIDDSAPENILYVLVDDMGRYYSMLLGKSSYKLFGENGVRGRGDRSGISFIMSSREVVFN